MYASSDEDEAPAPLPLVSYEPPVQDPIPEVVENEDPAPEQDEEKPKKGRSLPKRATEAPRDKDDECDFTNYERCFCRAWNPMDKMTDKATKDQKTTCAGRCSAGTDNGKSLREVCEAVANGLDEMPYHERYEGMELVRELGEKSSDYWRKYPAEFNRRMMAEYGELADVYKAVKEGEDWADHCRMCSSHYNTAMRGRLMGFEKATIPSNEKTDTHYPFVVGSVNGGEEHLVMTEMGFVWDDPNKMAFYNPDLKGKTQTGLRDVKATKDGKWDASFSPPDTSALSGDSKRIWWLRNLNVRTEYPEFAHLWQEQDWTYLSQ